ncbi:MAG TPA: hypothetical protein VGG01_04950 [Xanthobacteraceae bacterium]|jgi:hypothetical protein
MFQPDIRRSSARLHNEISQAPAATSALVSAALDLVGARCAVPHGMARTQRVRALIDAQAWTDAALAIADLDRSRTIRHLVHEDGEWRCAIGSPWAVPDWLGDTATFSHPVLALAILGALIDTLSWAPTRDTPQSSAPRWPSCEADSISAVTVDNYC